MMDFRGWKPLPQIDDEYVGAAFIRDQNDP